jgi:hypothetical protein
VCITLSHGGGSDEAAAEGGGVLAECGSGERLALWRRLVVVDARYCLVCRAYRSPESLSKHDCGGWEVCCVCIAALLLLNRQVHLMKLRWSGMLIFGASTRDLRQPEPDNRLESLRIVVESPTSSYSSLLHTADIPFISHPLAPCTHSIAGNITLSTLHPISAIRRVRDSTATLLRDKAATSLSSPQRLTDAFTGLNGPTSNGLLRLLHIIHSLTPLTTTTLPL